MGHKAFTPQGEALGFEIPLVVGSPHQGRGLWPRPVSAFPAHFDVVSLLFAQSEGVIPLVFSFFFTGSCSICSCEFNVFMLEGELRMFLCHHLEPEPLFFLSGSFLGFHLSVYIASSFCTLSTLSMSPQHIIHSHFQFLVR